MNIFLHFPRGTTTIIDGIHSGYEYDRKDTLLTAHIQSEHYNLIIDQYSITARYKYITVRYMRGYSIGRKHYHWSSVEYYQGKERVHLQYLLDLIHEAIHYRTFEGHDIDYWRISQLTQRHNDQ